MRPIALMFVLLASVYMSRPVSADEAPKRSEELKVLERFIGNWETTITIKATGEKYHTTESRKWSKAGQFVLSEDLNLSTKKEAHFLLTYDPNAKAYRTCFIDEGNTIMLLGSWDKETQTMKWTGTDSVGNKHAGSNRLIDKDHFEWSLAVSDPDGKVLVELSAKQTRRKQ